MNRYKKFLKKTLAAKLDVSRGGFTITEVLIVLAIAGTIITIIYLAVPQLQRNQRDSQRKTIGLRIKTELEVYASNNQGSYPFGEVGGGAVSCNSQTQTSGNCRDWFERYVSGKFDINDPTTASPISIYYDNTIAMPTPDPWAMGNVYIKVGGQCSGSSVTGTSGSSASKKYALLTALEISGVWYCVDNR